MVPPSQGGPARPGHRFLSKRKRRERKAGGLRPPWPPQYGGSWRRWAVQTGQRPGVLCRPFSWRSCHRRCRALGGTHRGYPASPGSSCAVPSAPAGPPPVPCRRNTGAVTAAIRRGDLWSPAPSRGGRYNVSPLGRYATCRTAPGGTSNRGEPQLPPDWSFQGVGAGRFGCKETCRWHVLAQKKSRRSHLNPWNRNPPPCWFSPAFDIKSGTPAASEAPGALPIKIQRNHLQKSGAPREGGTPADSGPAREAGGRGRRPRRPVPPRKESGGCGDRRTATCILHLFVVYSNKVNSTCSPPAGSPAGFAVSSLPPRGRYMTHGPPAREGSN